MKKKLAIFDFDGTMIKGDSLIRFLWYYSNPFVFAARCFHLLPVMIKYAMGFIDEHSAKEKVYMLFFAWVPRKQFMEKASLFSMSVIPLIVREEAVRRLRWHQGSNHDCILVSASIEDYLLPWAESAGFSSVVATKLETDGSGKITGKFSGRNCKGAEKVARIKEVRSDLSQYEIYAYGDSRGDKELLEIADHPFYRSFEKEISYPV
ncbi:MAG: HAD-IB family hydrolase [Nitrospiraceae bacterium]|nr:MAG: HAD-IB family hydrolase [Nitrospiraceae bacterium]